MKKLKQDLKNTKYNNERTAVKILIETFGDLISGAKFMAWLASKLDYLLHRSTK